MRIRMGITDIFEVVDIYVTPCGKPDENNPGKYTDMICELTMICPDTTDELCGEFDCDDATTFEECYAKAKPFFDELYENGCIDLSTEEKWKQYGITLY